MAKHELNRRSGFLGGIILGGVLLSTGCCPEEAPRAQPTGVAVDAGSPVCVAPDAGHPTHLSARRELLAQRLPEFPLEPPVVADEDAVVYRGRVVTKDGDGIAGARVRWVGFPSLVNAPGRLFVGAPR